MMTLADILTALRDFTMEERNHILNRVIELNDEEILQGAREKMAREAMDEFRKSMRTK